MLRAVGVDQKLRSLHNGGDLPRADLEMLAIALVDLIGDAPGGLLDRCQVLAGAAGEGDPGTGAEGDALLAFFDQGVAIGAGGNPA